MINPEITSTRIRNVIDYEVNYARKAFQKELENQAKQNAKILAKKDKELSALKEKLDEYNISY